MRTTIRHTPLAVLVLCICTACAAAAGGDRPPGMHLGQEDTGFVQVTNDGHGDVVLYLFRDNMRYRLGRVARMETGRFRIPAAAGGSLPSYQVQLVAEPVSGTAGAFSTGAISWRPGQNLAGHVTRSGMSEQFLVFTR